MIALLAALAIASPCDDADAGLPTGPAVAGLFEGDLGLARRLCPRTEVAIGGGGQVLIDRPAFYGHLVVSGNVQGSLAIDERTELFLEVEAVRFDRLITPIPTGGIGPGHTALGLTRVVSVDEDVRIGALGRIVLPTAVTLYPNTPPVSVEGAMVGIYDVGRVDVHWQIGATGRIGIGRGPQQLRIGLAPTVGVEYRAGRALGLVADLSGSFGLTSRVDYAAAAVGVRTAVGRVGLELAGNIPLAGRRPPIAAAELRIAVRL